MKKYKFKINFKDKRGVIVDLLQEKFDAITYVTIKKGKIRANHYHKKTIQWNFILSGKVNIFYKKNIKSKIVKKILLKKNDFVMCDKYEPHAFKSLSNCELLVLTKGPRQGKEYESDTFRLKNLLVE